jgi:hypothetical protein
MRVGLRSGETVRFRHWNRGACQAAWDAPSFSPEIEKHPVAHGYLSAREPSLRERTSAIRHLDAARAKRLVELFARPVAIGGRGLAHDPNDPVAATSYGWVSLESAGGRAPEADGANHVGHFSTHLYLHELLRLPLSVARELARHRGHLYLDKLVRITDLVAEELAQHKGGGLSLNNIRRLSPAAAQALGRHRGELSLNRIRFLSPAAAASLARNEFELYLGGLEGLWPKSAAALSTHLGNLVLEGLATLPGRVASHLARHRRKLHIHGISTLSNAAAAALGKRTGYLCLQSIERLSAEQASLLAAHQGALLFHRLSVDDAVAEALGRHEGSLALQVDRRISLTTLAHIMQHRGQVVLGGVEAITEAQARLLAAQVHRHGVAGLSGLFLNDVRHITASVAAILATHRAGELSLGGIKLLTEDVAQELVKHPTLCLDGVTSVTDRMAAILATHSGAVLSLKGLKNLSGTGLAKLRENPSIELPRRFYESGPQTSCQPTSRGACSNKSALFREIEQIAAQGEVVLGKA